MLRYVALPCRDESELWLVAYEIPGVADRLSVIMVGMPERTAREEVARLNARAAAADPPAERRLAPGFYTDE